MTKPQNIIGPQIAKLRRAKNLTQDLLAARCGTLGWDISENTITKIETGVRCVTDQELVILTAALRVKLREILPNHLRLF